MKASFVTLYMLNLLQVTMVLFLLFKSLSIYFFFLVRRGAFCAVGIFGDVKIYFFIVTFGNSKCYCHLLSQDRGCCQIFYGAQDSLPQSELSILKHKSSKCEKLWLTLQARLCSTLLNRHGNRPHLLVSIFEGELQAFHQQVLEKQPLLR